jgi:phosphatidylserine decarboxylase
VSGDSWNVNPIALRRIEKLYCKNERAVIDLHTDRPGSGICLVPVAAILVAGIKLHCLNGVLAMNYGGPNRLCCDAQFQKGDELGYFQRGSTILVFATPDHDLCRGVSSGERIYMGQPLLASNTGRGCTRPKSMSRVSTGERQ